MRFTIAAVAFFAGLVAADTTVFETEQVTVTSCGPEVTNCPASSGVATSVPVVATSAVVPNGVGAASSGAPSWTTAVPAAPATTGAAAPAGGNTAAQSYTVIAHTTCVPTVVYSTIPIAQTTSPVGSGSGSGSGSGPAGSGAPHVPSSSKAAPSGASASASPSSTPVYSGAGAISGSMGFAGLFAAAAYILA
ncbi:uncharacterized protein N7483_010874 [Penicillium malachiteum]|uniref:uncharacterized protein n=1 Tax=Penicillium malachiteum TaxID=1324776 RepID=UPI00254815C0|nr:uncharacterized protein N7483_010874 [Penicillium malachiteum]KAJ5713693.1 hypothetical protein N7483_010874 [Penicillium malachiteum]